VYDAADNERGIMRGLRLDDLRPRRIQLLAMRAVIKMKIPTTCSVVHSLSNRKKLKNNVVALRAVEVMDMVKAPKFLVMAAEQEDPKNPMQLNKSKTKILP
jgi:hypothetical protein